jgi:DNA polymerase (family X)
LYSDCYNDRAPARPDEAFPAASGDGAADQLVRPCDIRGILHSHSRWADGAHSLSSMVATAQEIGLEYLGISDHFRTTVHPDGLDLQAVGVQRQEIDRLRQLNPSFDILQGIELDADPDGSLPLNEEQLGRFDYVIVSFPANAGYDMGRLTDQIIRATEQPRVTILGKPMGEFMLQGPRAGVDMRRVLEAAALHHTAVEVTANPCCAELDWSHCRLAQELGVYMAISPDAHRAARLVDYRHGTELARAAGVCCGSILNTLDHFELRRHLARGR